MLNLKLYYYFYLSCRNYILTNNFSVFLFTLRRRREILCLLFVCRAGVCNGTKSSYAMWVQDKSQWISILLRQLWRKTGLWWKKWSSIIKIQAKIWTFIKQTTDFQPFKCFYNSILKLSHINMFFMTNIHCHSLLIIQNYTNKNRNIISYKKQKAKKKKLPQNTQLSFYSTN